MIFKMIFILHLAMPVITLQMNIQMKDLRLILKKRKELLQLSLSHTIVQHILPI